MASHKPQRIKRTSRRQQGLEPLLGGTQGVVGSAETGSPSRGTLAYLREASTTSPLPADARLGSPSHRSHSPSPLPSAPELLSLRRDYHRAATRAVMAGHHLEYLNAASVPQGLQLTLSPQVYAADTSSVDSEISEILATAQSNLSIPIPTYAPTLKFKRSIISKFEFCPFDPQLMKTGLPFLY